MDEGHVFDRFLSLAQRELVADDVRLLEPGEEPPQAENAVFARLPDGRHVVASFATAPKDREALSRRLGILAGTFADALGSPPSERGRARPPVVTSLHEELKALVQRARAVDVVVIDGDSPVVWGSASVAARPLARTDLLLRDVSDRELSARDEPSAPAPLVPLHAVPDESGPLMEPTEPTGQLRMAPPPPESAISLEPRPDMLAEDEADDHAEDSRVSALDPRESPRGSPRESREEITDLQHEGREHPPLTRRAIGHIRQLPTLDMLHKGKHLRHASRVGDFYLVLSFSGIYLLCIVFDGEFDELRAERAAHESLPRIERLVQALPPLHPDPEPVGGAMAMRRPPRRR